MKSICDEKKLKNKCLTSKNGFTLVELIVVLVILAIVAAIAVPAMMGFTDSAKEKQYTNEAKIALTSSQSMMSHVYNDNLDSVPQYLRNQAFESSGLDKNTEFLIWTKDRFDDVADGTYNSISAYTIESALYRASDGKYVYYSSSDSNNNNKESWEIMLDLKQVPKFDKNGSIKKNTNLIVVWSDNAQYASKDTAKGSNKADNSGVSGENGDSTPDNDKDKRFDNNQDNYDPDEEKDEEEKKVLVNYIGATNKSGDKNVVYFDEKTTANNENIKDKEFWYGSINGFRVDDDFSNWDIKTDDNYDVTKLTWSYEINSDDISDSAGFESVDLGDKWSTSEIGTRILSVINFLNEGAEITVTASIDQKYYFIPMTFRAFNGETQTVTIYPDTTNITCKYGRGEKDITYLFGTGDDSETVSELTNDNIVVSSADENRKIKFTDDPVVAGKWLIEIPDKGKNNYLSERITTVGINEWISGYLDSIDEAKAENLEYKGIEFIACGNIYKTIYVSATQGTEKHPNRTTFSFGTSTGMQTDEGDKNLKIELSVTEYDDEKYIYKSNGETDTVLRKITNIDTDSLFGVKGSGTYDSTTSTDIVTINKGTQHVKSWEIFDCNKSSGVKLDDNVDAETRKWDCSSYLLNRLFVKNTSSDAEYAELDTADFEALLKVYNNDETAIYEGTDTANTYCPFRAGLETLVGKNEITKIEKILYVSPQNKPNYRNTSAGFVGELCLSTTTLKKTNDGLLYIGEDGKYKVDHFDADYPAYVVAYAVLANKKYTIYVFSDIIDEDEEVIGDTTQAEIDGNKDIICKGDLINMFRGLEGMDENTLISHIDTSGANSFMNMFKLCKKMNSIDASHLRWDNCTRAESMFSNCLIAKTITLGTKTAPNLTNINEMFVNCYELNSVDISNFDTTHASKLYRTFCNCKSVGFTNIELHIDSATTMKEIFSGCLNLESVKFIGGGYESECPVSDLSGCYNSCSKLNKVSVNNLKLKNNVLALFFANKSTLKTAEIISVHLNDGNTSFAEFFKEYKALENVKFDSNSTKYITNMKGLFRTCTALTGEGISKIDMSSVDSTVSMFNSCSNLEYRYIKDKIDTSNATNISYMFENCKKIQDNIDKISIHIDKVLDIRGLFKNCGDTLTYVEYLGDGSSSNKISALNENYAEAYTGCNNLKTVAVKEVRFTKLSNINRLYGNSSALENVIFEGVSIENATSFYESFKNYYELKNVSFTNTVISNVSSMQSMFENCYNLQTVNWGTGINTTNVTSMNSMFKNCYSIKKLDLSSFNTSNVKSFASMFGTTNVTYKNTSYVESELTKIIASNSFVVGNNYLNQTMFGEKLTNLVGGNNTRFSTSNTKANYAHIDAIGNPGYFSSN